MTQITGITLPEDGNTASTSDYNPILTKIIDTINGKLSDDNITPGGLSSASLDASADPASLVGDVVNDFLVGGGDWAIDSGFTGTMSEATVMISGTEYTVSAIGAKVFSASVDTYVDLDSTTAYYTTTSVNGTEPALTAGRVRVARVRTDGSGITQIDKIRGAGVIRDKVAHDVKTPRVLSQATASTLTPDVGDYDQYVFTGLASTLTIAAPVGYARDGQGILFRFKDNGTARTLSFNSIYRAMGVTIPTATVASKITYVGAVYNLTDNKWDVIAVGRQA